MIKKIVFSILLVMSVGSIHAQMKRVSVNGNFSSNVIEVFEMGAVDVDPAFPGGECEMINFINQTRCYPADAHQSGIQGRVTCAFVVCPDGTIDYVEVMKSVHPSIDKEARRIINRMPRWSAGVVNGKKVHVRCVVIIPFRL